MKDRIKVAAFTGGENEPCARFRVRQNIPELLNYGVQIDDLSSSLGTFPPPQKWLRPAWGIGNLLQHLPKVVQSYQYDVSLIQREFLSTFYTLEGLTKRPRVLDVDDAIWIYRGGRAATKLAQITDHVICGNKFLANWFGKINPNITIIPTAVDANLFCPSTNLSSDKLLIGWVSTSSSYNHLYKIEEALAAVLKQVKGAKLRIVSDLPPNFSLIKRQDYEYIKWTPQNQVQVIQDLTVGIMPLEDTEFARGKCSYKMLTYMSCGVPVVVSPVGMNNEVLAMGEIGVGVSKNKEWADALIYLLKDNNKAKQMGKQGRTIVLNTFDVPVIAEEIADVFKQLL